MNTHEARLNIWTQINDILLELAIDEDEDESERQIVADGIANVTDLIFESLELEVTGVAESRAQVSISVR